MNAQTDQELQLGLAKLLPDRICGNSVLDEWELQHDDGAWLPIMETEWLHVCWLVEMAMSTDEYMQFEDYFGEVLDDASESSDAFVKTFTGTWQQRAEAILKAKGIKP